MFKSTCVVKHWIGCVLFSLVNCKCHSYFYFVFGVLACAWNRILLCFSDIIRSLEDANKWPQAWLLMQVRRLHQVFSYVCVNTNNAPTYFDNYLKNCSIWMSHLSINSVLSFCITLIITFIVVFFFQNSVYIQKHIHSQSCTIYIF